MSWLNPFDRTRLTEQDKRKWWGAIIIALIAIPAFIFVYLMMR